MMMSRQGALLPVHGAGHHVGHGLCRVVDHRHPAHAKGPVQAEI